MAIATSMLASAAAFPLAGTAGCGAIVELIVLLVELMLVLSALSAAVRAEGILSCC